MFFLAIFIPVSSIFVSRNVFRITEFVNRIWPFQFFFVPFQSMKAIKRLIAQSQEFFESNLMQNVELRTVSYS